MSGGPRQGRRTARAQPRARLSPLLGREVGTPLGRGRLVQVFAELAAVVLGGRVVFLATEEVLP